MPADDLFVWLDACWNKKQPQGTPPTYMMHRFLASNPDAAPLARQLQLQVREPALVFRIWQGCLPKAPGAPQRPRLSYIAAKKRPAEEALVTRMRQVLAERREVIEEMIAVVKLVGRERDLYHEFGVKEPGDDDE